ncbi:FUSC family protein [Vagococcus sp. DIV0080]|uniref:FUSC family protein n=1 Tax=Candidatus Vagococcus giribetii TaxID=2230876 RepID=A0ABS3HUD8_9ENTE|nr:FUSC family protein [Vagococcus sp. DIV0080]MBO0477368.1 FUSC family protein [Vagococcus sp. DIV0080]
MYWGKYHIGLRTVKTSLAVMCCILVFQLTDRGTPIVATLAAVFALREDLSSSIDFGKSRILGNTIGGFGAFFYYACLRLFQNEAMGQLIFIPLIVAIIISFSIRINNPAGIIGGIATFLFIAFSIPKEESYLYAFNRVIDTFIGTFIAVFWNFVIKSPFERDTNTIENRGIRIKNKEKEIEKLQQELNELKGKEQHE